MTTASVTTDIHIGPFKIPSNGQNMIMNNYAQRNNLIIEFVIPEPMMSNALATVQWLHKENKFSKVILCSIHQLPKQKKRMNDLIKSMKNVEFHFALEGISGKGKKFILSMISEANIFSNSKILESDKTNWLSLYKMINPNKKI
jgi:sporadic carbohydrate cluster protein (TIGR04323 family)|tara:strand:- start:2361 stop:2792 length:432 start_codon:yes stop_codon:yes gene_type:complete